MNNTIKELNCFLNKPVTIITNQINRKFDEAQNVDYFTGICESITEDGVFTYHPITKCKNFFLFHSIIGIFEEQTIQDDILNENLNREPDQETTKEPRIKQQFFKENNTIDINELNKLIS